MRGMPPTRFGGLADAIRRRGPSFSLDVRFARVGQDSDRTILDRTKDHFAAVLQKFTPTPIGCHFCLRP